MTDRRVAGQSSRRKGAAFEQALARKFTGWWGAPVRRTPMSGAYGDAWSMAGDLMFAGPCSLHVEAKYRQGWRLDHLFAGTGPVFGWWEEAISEAPEGSAPLLVFSAPRRPVFVMHLHRGLGVEPYLRLVDGREVCLLNDWLAVTPPQWFQGVSIAISRPQWFQGVR